MHILFLPAQTGQCDDLIGLLRAQGNQVEVLASQADLPVRLAGNPPPLVLLEAMAAAPDVCRQIRKLPEGRQSCIVLAVPAGHGESLPQALAAGADDFVSVPWDAATLEARLHVALQHARQSSLPALRQQVTRSVRLREDEFRSLAENAPDVIARFDVRYRHLYVNKRIEEFTGLPPVALIGKSHRELGMPPDLCACWEARLREALDSGRPVTFEFTLHGARGATDFEARVIPEFDVQGESVSLLGICRDLTERRRAEAALRQAEHRMRRMYDAGIIGLIEWNAAGAITAANDAFLKIIAYSREDLEQGRIDWRNLTPPEFLERDIRALKEIAASGSCTPFEKEYIAKDGRRVPIMLAGVSLGETGDSGLAFVLDIGTHKRTEKELRAAKEYAENLIRTANAMIVGLDAEGRVQIFNGEAERITGYTRDELSGRNWFEILAPREKYPEAWREGHLANHQHSSQFEGPILTRDGRERIIQWRNSALISQGRTIGTISFGLDVTEHRSLEEQLRQSQKMEAIGRLAGGVAHDFNNLLLIVLGYGEMLARRCAGDPTLLQSVEQILKAGRRASDLTRQLLAFSRKQVLSPRILNLNDVVAEMERMLHRLIGEHINLQTRLNPDLSRIRADRSQVEQVLLNLAINARDAMPLGGTLSIETGHAGAAHDALAGTVTGPYVTLVVRDTGIGMDEQVRQQVFEPFFTTKEVGKGTGLGLSTVYGIVRQSEGAVAVDSTPGQGACFTVYFPAMRETSASHGSGLSSAVAGGGAETILLVEDEDGVRALFKEVLETKGYQVLDAADGAAALELAGRHNGGLDLLVTDIVMPNLDGRQLARRLRDRHPGLPVLFTSGYTGDAVGQADGAIESTHFLQKPFEIEALARKIRELLDATP